MDETAICVFQGGGKGNIFVRRTDPMAVQNVTRGQRRTYFTHVAFICDQPELQPLLPQVLVGNEHTFQAGQMAAMQAACPPNVQLIRQRSSWNNSALCARIIRRLGETLSPYSATHQPILLFDAHRVHLTKEVFDACAAAGVWPVVVAAKMTAVLQPLDTHAFLLYKIHIQQAYQRARLGTADGTMTVADVLPCVCDAIRHVLQGNRWEHAFDRDGFGRGQGDISNRVKASLDIDAPPMIPAGRPTLEQLKVCFPKRASIPTRAIWRPFDAPAAVVSGDVPNIIGAGPHLGPPLRRTSLRIAAAKAKVGGMASPALPFGGVPAKAAAKAVIGPMTRARARALSEP